MSGRKAKTLRRLVREAINTDLEGAWRCMVACPWRARLSLAWRLARGRQMDGSRKEAQ